jgi:hypothetical protein
VGLNYITGISGTALLVDPLEKTNLQLYLLMPDDVSENAARCGRYLSLRLVLAAIALVVLGLCVMYLG